MFHILILRFGLFLVVALYRRSALLLRFGLRFITRSLLFTGPLLLTLAVLLSPLSIAVTLFTVIRFVLATSLPVFILGFVGIF